MDLIRNPLADPQLWSFLFRTLAIMGLGLVVMALTQLRNLKGMLQSLAFKKYLSWLVILPAVLIVAHSGRAPVLAAIVFLMWHASLEMLQLLRIRPFFRKVFLVHQLVTVVVMVFFPEDVLYLPLYYLLATFFAAGARNRVYHVVDQIAFSIIASFWIGFILALLGSFTLREDAGAALTTVFGAVVLSDVFAYLFGNLAKKLGLGTAKLASNISPNKVVAGVVGNVVGVGICLVTYGGGLGLGWALGGVVVVLAGLAAAYGDLAESIVKRHAGVKDSSTLIPFHGGMLDRIDSLLFVVPIFYLAFNMSVRWPF